MKFSLKPFITFCLIVVPMTFAFEAVAQAQELVLYTMCPPKPINWKSPRTLALAAVSNNITFHHIKHKHAIGHVFIELRNGEERDLTGSVPASGEGADNDADLIFKQGLGLGILFYPFKGLLEPATSLDAQLPDRYKSGRVAYIEFKLSQSTYDRLKKYLKEYRARGYDKIYNGTNEPRKGKGAGCSGFGVSLLDVAGLLHPTWAKIWARDIHVANDMIGAPLSKNKVSLLKILAKGSWGQPGKDSRYLHLFDPELIYNWIHETYKKESFNQIHAPATKGGEISPIGKAQLVKRDKALGLRYDVSHVPTPTEPIFQNE